MELGGNGCNCGGWLQGWKKCWRRRASGSKPGFFRRVGLVRRSGTAPPVFLFCRSGMARPCFNFRRSGMVRPCLHASDLAHGLLFLCIVLIWRSSASVSGRTCPHKTSWFFKNYVCVASGFDFFTACIVAGISSKSEKLINDGFTHFKINLRSERGPVQKWW